MSMTLDAMITSIRNHGFSDADSTTLTELINDAYESVWTRQAWPFKEAEADVTAPSGNATVTLPSDFGKLLALGDDINGNELEFRRLDELMYNVIGSLTAVGLPSTYYFVGNVLKVWPVPDTTYTFKLKYIKKFTPLSAGTDIPALPNNHRIVVLGALASAYDMEDDTDLAIRFEGRFENRIVQLQEEWWARQYDMADVSLDIYANEDNWNQLIL